MNTVAIELFDRWFPVSLRQCRGMLVGLCLVMLLGWTGSAAGSSIGADDWWPSQRPPRKIVKVTGLSSPAECNLAQSIIGLAAAAVNNGTHDELVWLDTAIPEYVRLLDRTEEILGISDVRTIDLWQLLDEYRARQIIRGYIVYTSEDAQQTDLDASVNIATTIAAFEQGVLIERSLQQRAEQAGLTCLADADQWTMQQCFETYRSRANRRMLVAISPGLWHMRDMAIAHKCFTIYGTHEIVSEIMAWLDPLSMIMGWNKGPEDVHVELAARWGHFETASNYCMNLTVTSCIRSSLNPAPVSPLKPWEIDFDKGQDFVSFLYSDGDNVQWTMGAFCQSPTLWKSPLHGTFPMSWSNCPAHLLQVSPETFNYFAQTKPASTSLVEFCGGYFFPDQFASSRPDRLDVLTKQAQRLSRQCQKTGVRVVGAIFKDVSSQAAKEAYRVYARQIEGLLGMVAIQYSPYDGGDGQVFWYPNADGVEIPIVTVKYSFWEKAQWPRGGETDKIAALVRENAEKADDQTFTVVINHAWSKYERPGENSGTVSDLEAVKWLYDEISGDVTVVNIEELIWRARMKHSPLQTRQAIDAMKHDLLLP